MSFETILEIIGTISIISVLMWFIVGFRKADPHDIYHDEDPQDKA